MSGSGPREGGAGLGGYHALTRSAANRCGYASAGAGVGAGTRSSQGGGRAGERVQWSVAKSFFSQGDVAPSSGRGGARKTSAKVSPTAIPGTARLVAQAFGIERKLELSA